MASLDQTFLPKLSLQIPTPEKGYAAFSGDGNKIAICRGFPNFNHNLTQVLDTRTGKVLKNHPEDFNRVALNSDGTVIACLSLNQIFLFDLGPEDQPSFTNRVLISPNSLTTNLIFSSDGKRLVWNDIAYISIWEKHTNQFDMKSRKALAPIAISPDNKLLAAADYESELLLELRDVETNVSLNKLRGHMDNIKAVTFSPDSQLIATASLDGTVCLWDAHTFALIYTYHGHTGAVWSVAFSRNGKYLASGGASHAIWIWDVYSGKAICSLEIKGMAHAVGFSADGKRVSACSFFSFQTWDISKWQVNWTPENHSKFSKNGKAVLRTLVLGLNRLICVKTLTRVDPACLEMEIFSGINILDV